MRRKLCFLLCFIIVGGCYFVGAREIAVVVEEKQEAGGIPLIATQSPPEGNTTFIDGTTWCVARAGVSQLDLQKALDWACGPGRADCGPIQVNGPCFRPNTLLAHASYAFNNYYQQNGNSDIACNFGGTATLIKNDPSYGKCAFAASGSLKSSASQPSDFKAKITPWKMAMILLLLYLGITNQWC